MLLPNTVGAPAAMPRTLSLSSSRMLLTEMRSSPETGLRPVIVDHLRAAERTLNTMAFLLRTKHPKMKWNIKYDDDEMNLKLDFCTSGKTWKTVLPDQAKKIVDQRKALDKRISNSVSAKDLDDLLESDGDLAHDEQELKKDDVAGAREDGRNKKKKKTNFVCLTPIRVLPLMQAARLLKMPEITLLPPPTMTQILTTCI